MTWSPSPRRSRPWSTNTHDELIADRAMQQRGDHRGVDAAGETEQHLAAADLRAHALDRIVDDIAGAPERIAAADLAHEALEQARALRGVGHFGMELHAVEAAALIAMAANGMVAVLAADDEPGGSAATRSPWLIQTSSTQRPSASRRSSR